METNILKALNNMTKLESFQLTELYSGQNRMNNVGTALEYFVRDIFCSSISVVGLENKNRKHSEYLTYLGNKNNPPDFIIKNGDAVEVKKIKYISSNIQLNGSYPKSKLHRDDSRLGQGCRECDDGNWKEKELFYVIGNIKNGVIKYLFFIQGTCYIAENAVYSKIIKDKKSIYTIGNSKLKTTARFYKMINPLKAFNDILPENKMSIPMSYVLMMSDKYNSFPKVDTEKLYSNKKVVVKDVKIKNPNGLDNLLDAKLIYTTL